MDATILLLLILFVQSLLSGIFFVNPTLFQAVIPSSLSFHPSSNVSTPDPVLPLVTVGGPGSEDLLRRFVSRVHSIRRRYKPETQHAVATPVVIYSVDLPAPFVSEARLWDDVNIFEVSDFVKLTAVNASLRSDPGNLSRGDPIALWRPYCIKHAVDLHGKVLFLDSSVILSSSFSFAPLNELLSDLGSLFIQTVSSDWGGAPHDVNCDARLQGFVRGKFAYTNILLPQLDCAKRVCTGPDYLLLLEANKAALLKKHRDFLAVSCQANFSSIFQTSLDRYEKAHCQLRHRDSVVFAKPRPLRPPVNVSSPAPAVYSQKRGPPVITLGFPATSIGMASNATLLDSAFMLFFLPSFVKSVNPGDAAEYRLLMGIDAGDGLFDQLGTQEQLRSLVAEATKGYPVTFHILRFAFSQGWVVYLWNGLFEAAVDAGTDYFYQLNDDIVLLSANWSSTMVAALRHGRFSDFGIATPLDVDNKKVATQALASRLHFDIFGYFYPAVFHNWLSDTWLSYVYSKTIGAAVRTHDRVQNKNNVFGLDGGPRYKPCKDMQLFHDTLDQTKATIMKYIIYYQDATSNVSKIKSL